MFFSFLEELEKKKFDMSSLETGIISGSMVVSELVKNIMKVMTFRNFTVAYGMTEASPLVLNTRFGDSFETITSKVGRVIPN